MEVGEFAGQEILRIVDPDEIKDLAVMLYEHIEAQINRADTKAQLILAADTLLATTIAALGKGILADLFGVSTDGAHRMTALLATLMFAALLTSAFYALVVARPILRSHDGGTTLFYFGQIAKSNSQDFIAKFSGLSPVEVKQSLLTEIHAMSEIAKRKFVWVQHSLDFLVAALVLWSLNQVLQALAH